MKAGLFLLVSLLLTGCGSSFFGTLRSAFIDGCPVNEIRFTQATGCRNDGSFEFCVANDPALAAEIEQLSPNVACAPGRGRAQCNFETELLCMVSTDGLCLPPRYGPINDAGWQLVCELAAHPAIDELVATWYE